MKHEFQQVNITLRDIARRLGMTSAEAVDALDDLQRRGLLMLGSGDILNGEMNLLIPTEGYTRAIISESYTTKKVKT